MKKIIIATTLLLASISHADIIKCSFTEPFFNTTYSTSQSTLTYEGDVDGDSANKTVVKNVSFQIKSAGVFELVSKEGKVLQTLQLNNKGSNGMSDAVYPYDAKDHSKNVFGGCQSNYLKAKGG